MTPGKTARKPEPTYKALSEYRDQHVATIRCDTPDCDTAVAAIWEWDEVAFPHDSYMALTVAPGWDESTVPGAWDTAVNAGWRTDAVGYRRCPACLKKPEIRLYCKEFTAAEEMPVLALIASEKVTSDPAGPAIADDDPELTDRVNKFMREAEDVPGPEEGAASPAPSTVDPPDGAPGPGTPDDPALD